MLTHKHLTVCGTGHRPDKLDGYSDDAYNKLIQFAEITLNVFEPTKVISGMALGWDIALAQAAINLNIPLIAAIPFVTQPERWFDKYKQRYNDILSKADDTVIVCSGFCEPWKFQKRNEYMVDNADAVLALWDGSSGGTANCVKYANQKDVKVYQLWRNYTIYKT